MFPSHNSTVRQTTTTKDFGGRSNCLNELSEQDIMLKDDDGKASKECRDEPCCSATPLEINLCGLLPHPQHDTGASDECLALLLNCFQKHQNKTEAQDQLCVDIDQQQHPAFRSLQATFLNWPAQNWSRLASLQLSHNGLSSLPDGLFALTSLTDLVCTSPPQKKNTQPSFHSLFTIEFVKNKMLALPFKKNCHTSYTDQNTYTNSLWRWPLKDVSFNRLETVSADVAKLVNLRSLNLWANPITALPCMSSSVKQLISWRSVVVCWWRVRV